MFEIIGIVFTVIFIFLLLFIQYTLILFGVMKESLKWYGRVISWIPLLPYFIYFILTISFIIMIMFDKFVKWFELNLGWFFINGRKQSYWSEYLKNKYKDE